MLVWRYVFLLVLTLLVLSTLAVSIVLATMNGCFDIGLGPEGLAIHFDPHCGRPKDERPAVRTAEHSLPSGVGIYPSLSVAESFRTSFLLKLPLFSRGMIWHPDTDCLQAIIEGERLSQRLAQRVELGNRQWRFG